MGHPCLTEDTRGMPAKESCLQRVLQGTHDSRVLQNYCRNIDMVKYFKKKLMTHSVKCLGKVKLDYWYLALHVPTPI